MIRTPDKHFTRKWGNDATEIPILNQTNIRARLRRVSTLRPPTLVLKESRIHSLPRPILQRNASGCVSLGLVGTAVEHLEIIVHIF